MSNIFTFRPRKKGSLSADFLKDADDSVEFGPAGPDVTLPPVTPNHTAAFMLRDWDNQELANIYRVKKLLDAAGVPNELERGVSDEGDPWCIFCMATGEVFIHLSRFDGRYILDSPNLKAPIVGADFTDLIAQFSAGALRATPEIKKQGSQVIKLERNGKVFLHPATLLAALIWSIYLNSEELVMLAPDQDLDGALDGATAALLNEAALAPLSDAEAAKAAHFLDGTMPPAAGVSLRVAAEGDPLRETTGLRDVAGKAAAFVAAPTPIAVGLSSVAIAFGLVSENVFDDTPLAEEMAAADTADTLLNEEIAQAERETTSAPRNTSFDLVAAVHAAFDTGSEIVVDISSDHLQAQSTSDAELNTVLLSSLTQPMQDDMSLANIYVGPNGMGADGPAKKDKGELSEEEATVAETADTEAAEEPKSTIARKSEETPQPEFDIAEIFELTTLDGSNMFVTYNVAGFSAQTAFEFSIKPSAGDSLDQPKDASDDQAQDNSQDQDTIEYSNQPDAEIVNPSTLDTELFFNYLIERAARGEIIREEHEIGNTLFFDGDAVANAPLEIATMTWYRKDGSTVEVVGLISDFEDFNLI